MVTKISVAVLSLLIANCYCYTSVQTVLNVVPGIFSTEAVSNGLNLPATMTFQPVTNLTVRFQITTPSSVFVHYQVTLDTVNNDLYTKLLMNNYFNTGSLVHSGNQRYKTATGFYMANLSPGYYKFEVHYKSPVAISMPASLDFQNAILQVMWFEDAYAVSDGIKCYPTPTPTNAFDNWGNFEDIEATLKLQREAVVLSAYQLSVDMKSPNQLVTSLEVDSFHYVTATLTKGNELYLSLHGMWARYMYPGLHSFKIPYHSPTQFSFTDCNEMYENNKNLYAMMLPQSCRVEGVVRPDSFLYLNNNSNVWTSTDITYSFKVSETKYGIVMYQYSGYSNNKYIVMRLKVNLLAQKSTVSLTGNTQYVGNFGLWQGPLIKGLHIFTLEYRSVVQTYNDVSSDLEWQRWNKWMNRAMTVIVC